MKIVNNSSKKILLVSHGTSMLFGIALGMTLTLLYISKKMILTSEYVTSVAVHVGALVVIAVSLRIYTIWLWKKEK